MFAHAAEGNQATCSSLPADTIPPQPAPTCPILSPLQHARGHHTAPTRPKLPPTFTPAAWPQHTIPPNPPQFAPKFDPCSHVGVHKHTRCGCKYCRDSSSHTHATHTRKAPFHRAFAACEGVFHTKIGASIFHRKGGTRGLDPSPIAPNFPAWRLTLRAVPGWHCSLFRSHTRGGSAAAREGPLNLDRHGYSVDRVRNSQPRRTNSPPHRCAVEWRLRARSGGALAGPDGRCCVHVPHVWRRVRLLCAMGPIHTHSHTHTTHSTPTQHTPHTPFDVVRTRMQGDAASGRPPARTASTLMAIVRGGGVRALWRGTGAATLRMGLGVGAHMVIVEAGTAALAQRSGGGSGGVGAAGSCGRGSSEGGGGGGGTPKLSSTNAAIVGGGARSLVSAVLCPITVVKTRMEYIGGTGAVAYRNTAHVVASILRDEGVRGLFRGLVPTVLSNAPFSGVYGCVDVWVCGCVDAWRRCIRVQAWCCGTHGHIPLRVAC
eukprot:366045-Chlamydomonas_euryale.AAC.3